MKINPNYNPESSLFSIEITSNLLRDYFNNFRGMLLDCNEIPNDVEVTKKAIDTALVTFKVKKEDMESVGKSIPSNILSEVKKMLGVTGGDVDGMMVSSGDIKPFEQVRQVVTKFVKQAAIYKFKKTEFIPLSNYPIENLKEDVVLALNAKRDFCIVDDFNKYRDAMDNKNYILNHKIVNYGTAEYCDVFLDILSGKSVELENKYNPQLKESLWLDI